MPPDVPRSANSNPPSRISATQSSANPIFLQGCAGSCEPSQTSVHRSAASDDGCAGSARGALTARRLAPCFKIDTGTGKSSQSPSSAGFSNGIETLYSTVFVRQVLDCSTLLQVNPVFRQAAEKAGLFSQKLVKKIARTGTLQRIPEIPTKLRRIFRCTYDIKPEWHIRMQAAFQSHCDAAVSKTVNLPENATPAAVDKAYRMACRLGCKGITIYRRQTRKNEPMSLCCRI